MFRFLATLSPPPGDRNSFNSLSGQYSMIEPLKWTCGYWQTFVASNGDFGKLRIWISTDGQENRPTSKQLGIAEKVGEYVPSLTKQMAELALAKCEELERLVDLELEGIHIDKANISSHFKINLITIGDVDNCIGEYYFVGCQCDWDEEHGLEFFCDADEILACDQSTGCPLTHNLTDAQYRGLAASPQGKSSG